MVDLAFYCSIGFVFIALSIVGVLAIVNRADRPGRRTRRIHNDG
jgi:hypothetical protein